MLKWAVISKRASTALDGANSAVTTANETNTLSNNQKPNDENAPGGVSTQQQETCLGQTKNDMCRRHSIGKEISSSTKERHKKRRHSHGNVKKMKSLITTDKENDYQCTPRPLIKDSGSYFRFDTIALRDVSNITPTSTPPNRKLCTYERCRSQPHEKKKTFCTKNDYDKFNLTPPSTRPLVKKRFLINDHDDIENRVPVIKKPRPFDLYFDKTNECQKPNQIEHSNRIASKKSCNKVHVLKNTLPLSQNSSENCHEKISFNIPRQSSPEIEQTLRENRSQKTFSKCDFPETNACCEKYQLQNKIVYSDDKICLEGPLANSKKQNTTHTSVLPTFQIEYSPCPMRSTQSVLGMRHTNLSNIPPYKSVGTLPNLNYSHNFKNLENKKTKIDHVNDFLHQISFTTSPEDIGMQFTGFKRKYNPTPDIIKSLPKENHLSVDDCGKTPSGVSERMKTNILTEIKMSVSPLTNRLADLKFSKIYNKTRDCKLKQVTDDDSDFDNLSLDKMVEAILETTEEPDNAYFDVTSTPRHKENDNQCMVHNCCSTPRNNIHPIIKHLQERENDLNHTKEDNFVNLEQEKRMLENCECVVNCHNLVKLNQNNCNDVITNFNEREVKTPETKLSNNETLDFNFENCYISSELKRNSRKRTSDKIVNSNESTNLSIESLEPGVHLKRQKCVRRKKNTLEDNKIENFGLTLENGIPSPNSALKDFNRNNSGTKSDNNNLIVIHQSEDKFKIKRCGVIFPNDIPLTPKRSINIDELLENLEETPLHFLPGYRQSANKIHFGLTLKNGIPSPRTPIMERDILDISKNGDMSSDINNSNTFGLTLINDNTSPYRSLREVANKSSVKRVLFGANSPETPYSEPWTPIWDEDSRQMKACSSLLNISSDAKGFLEMTITPKTKLSRDSLVLKGTIDLNIRYNDGKLLVHVIRCKDLYRLGNKSINAYVKVALISGSGDDSVCKEKSSGGFQRTSVHKDSANPHFDQMFTFDVSKADLNKRVHLAVWHRDKECRRSEFLGCMSFSIKHAVKKDVDGSYKLLSQTTGRTQNLPVVALLNQPQSQIETPQPYQNDSSSTLSTLSGNSSKTRITVKPEKASEFTKNPQRSSSVHKLSSKQQKTPTVGYQQLKESISDEQLSTKQSSSTVTTEDLSFKQSGIESKMGDNSQSSVEEILTLEEMQDVVSQDLNKVTTSKKKLNQQQKDADENLFLRYLELDPTEGPEAIPAAMQRKASGNKCGRTPFTTTKRLVRPNNSGFGFSVVWTHPPRVERVEQGLPADKAGILPGDYIIFVDKHNVVMMPEIDILNLIRSFGNTLTLEIFRRGTNSTCATSGMSAQNGLVAGSRSASVTIADPTTRMTVPVREQLQQPQPRSSTACSTNTASGGDYNRRRLHLPQVTFSSESSSASPEEARKRAMYQLIQREQHYSTAMQFGINRFSAPLAERKDLLSPTDHHILFQNIEDLGHITEDILDNLVLEDGDVQIHLIPRVYLSKASTITSQYRKYFSGLKKADCILANKTRNTNSEFVRFLHTPMIPRRRPDITSFIHKPLEHYREILKLLQTILSHTKSNSEDYPVVSKVVHELQQTYRDMTSSAGLMEPVGEGRPLLSVQDLESRLVFTRCKPFVLNAPGRQWIFGGDLSRVEGRNVRSYWALLFSDILLFAKVSRDRVLFITEEPLSLANITDIFFNIRKKATEFRINVDPGGNPTESPTAHCGPDLTRTPRKNTRRRCLVLRAPTTEMKAVWQNLLQRQIYHIHSGTGGTPFSSPMDSPDAPAITSSVATLQSADSFSLRRQTPQHSNRSATQGSQKHLDELIEHKCRQLGKSGANKGSALHLAQWMKGQLGGTPTTVNSEQTSPEEPEPEIWTQEDLKRRSRELHLFDIDGVTKNKDNELKRTESRCEEITISDGSPSKSTTSGSQVTVRSSPIVPETVPVCRQCHKTCLSANNSPNLNIHHTNNNIVEKCTNNATKNNCNRNTDNVDNMKTEKNDNNSEEIYDDWGSLMLMGLTAINPAASFLKMDPFAPTEVPKISVLPPTPDTLPRSSSSTETTQFPLICDNDNELKKAFSPKRSPKRLNLKEEGANDNEDSGDESVQNEEPPYLVMVPKNPGLKRYGTWSSLRIPSDELVEAEEIQNDKNSSSEEESEEDDYEDDEYEDRKSGNEEKDPITTSLRGWTARAGSFVAEKMALFEKLGGDSKAVLDRYLRPQETVITKQDYENDPSTLSSGGLEEEYENSGATSGEEVWGTPTSGGELDDIPTFPNSDGGTLSSPHDSNSSATCEDDDLMMDELLMAPPMTAGAIRGLLPRRRLEPLLEEEDTDSCTTTSVNNAQDDTTPSPEQGSESGGVADISSAALSPSEENNQSGQNNQQDGCQTHQNQQLLDNRRQYVGQSPVLSLSRQCSLDEDEPRLLSPPVSRRNPDNSLIDAAGATIGIRTSGTFSSPEIDVTTPALERLARTSSYRHIVEDDSSFFSRIRPLPRKRTTIVNKDIDFEQITVSTSHRSKSTRLLEFLSGRSGDRREEEQIGHGTGRQILKLFSKETSNGDDIPTTYSQRPFSPRRQNDKQLDRRFWKQLRRRRRGNITSQQIPAV